MSKRQRQYQRWRPLLTDTTPYEVPIIFSNDILFASLAEGDPDPGVSARLDGIRKMQGAVTVPYTYQIVKDRYRTTSLGLIHPMAQATIAEFYDSYAATISGSCNASEFSIRRPAEPASLFTPNEISPEATLREGIPHVSPEEGELDASRVSSYFTYKGYSLLSKFIDSPEFIRLEKRYARLRQLDVSRCFFHIYTHSISWALKGKQVAKDNRDQHSFEAAFDHLMQRANFGETNGIVIGPEISRIFAEIILQAIDRSIQSKLHPEVQHNRDYAIRRYVDDFYIFADLDDQLDKIQSVVEDALEDYKLFINVDKVESYSRPFVSRITLARRDARQTVQSLFEACSALMDVTDNAELRRGSRSIVQKIGDLRMVVGQHGVGFHTLSGWLLGSMRVLVANVVTMSNAETSDDHRAGLTDIIVALLELTSYVASLDLRVRTTYSLCQIALQAIHFAKGAAGDFVDRIEHTLHQELSLLIRSAASDFKNSDREDSVELYNLLIIANYLLGPSILDDRTVNTALELLLSRPKLTYFQYATLKFCYLRRPASAALLASVNSRAREKILSTNRKELWQSSELYHILCDYLASPDLVYADRRQVFEHAVGGGISNAELDGLRKHLAFIDWTGMRVEHLLRRKQLQPVYSSS